MGCLRRIFSLIIVILAFIGFKSIGGIEITKSVISELMHPKRADIVKAQNSFDFSKLSNDFEVLRPFDFMGVKVVMTNYEDNDQKFLIIDSRGLIPIKKKDFYSDKVEDIIASALNKFAYQAIRLEHFQVLSTGHFQALSQEIPYVIFESDLVRANADKMYGMIGVATAPDGQNDLLVSFCTDRGYDQLIAQEFFKNVQYKNLRKSDTL